MPYKRIEITAKVVGKREAPTIDSVETAAEVIRTISNHKTMIWREEALILCLNKANKLIGWHLLAVGGHSSVQIDKRIVVAVAALSIASGIILTHNHPGGNPEPSKQDIEVTQQVKRVVDILEVSLLDHIIITDQAHFSMREQGLL